MDLTGGANNDMEIKDLSTAPLPLVVAQLPGLLAPCFLPEIAMVTPYKHNLMEMDIVLGSDHEMVGSSVTPQEDELLDLEMAPDSTLAQIVGTGRLKSTTPKKKKFGGQGDPAGSLEEDKTEWTNEI